MVKEEEKKVEEAKLQEEAKEEKKGKEETVDKKKEKKAKAEKKKVEKEKKKKKEKKAKAEKKKVEKEKKKKKEKKAKAEKKKDKEKLKVKKTEKGGKKKKKNKMERNRQTMRPRIDATAFGSITIEGQKIKNDVILQMDGSIQKRKKKLFKKVYGASHKISLEEAKYVYEKGAEVLIIRAGQYSRVVMSEEAEKYINQKGCRVKLMATFEAIKAWNIAGEKVIGLFHVTC